ncbi:MAG TPA: DNA adenine methylase, partial [Thermoanaerobaculales bacterium]|nr:DNA adenine methylase [Thermoanaerobaculales bacterium]
LLFGGRGQHFGLDSLTTWVYCDPPYIGREHYYGQAGGVEFHQRLASVLSRCRSWVTISYADTEEFRAAVAPLYPGWHRVEFTAVQHMSIRGNGTGKGKRRELLLTNFEPAQAVLEGMAG